MQRHRGHHDHVATGEQRRGRRVAEPVDLVVDRRVLLDVGVARGDVRLGLVVVVVGDEVLDPVVGEELAELVGQLGRQALVGRQDQRRPLHLLDGPGHRRRLARAGDPQQRLEPLAAVDALGQALDRRRLVAGRLEVRHDLEGPHQRRLDAGRSRREGDRLRRTGRRVRCWWERSPDDRSDALRHSGLGVVGAGRPQGPRRARSTQAHARSISASSSWGSPWLSTTKSAAASRSDRLACCAMRSRASSWRTRGDRPAGRPPPPGRGRRRSCRAAPASRTRPAAGCRAPRRVRSRAVRRSDARSRRGPAGARSSPGRPGRSRR